MYKWLVAGFILATLMFISGCGLSEDTVAKVGNQTISKEEFTEALSRRFPRQDNYQNVPKEEKMDILDRMIEQKLQVNAAFDNNLDEDIRLQQEFRDRQLRVLGNKYFEREIVDQLLPHEVLQEHYNKQAKEVKASHILLGFKGLQRSQATRSKDEALKLAQELAERARSGESFPDLAEKYSDDPSAAKNKGDLGYFTWGRMVPAFQEAAFSLESGEISDPVLSDFGYHVIWVVDKRPNKSFDADAFEESVFELKRTMYRSKQAEGRKLWEDHINGLKEEKGFEIKEENMDSVVAWVSEKVLDGTFSAESFTEDQKKLVLVEWNDGEASLQNVFDLYGRNLARSADRIRNKSQFKTDLDNIGVQMMVVSEAHKKGYDEESDVREQLDSFLEQRMVSILNQQEINDKITIEDGDLESYYAEHKEEFTKPEEIMVWEVYVKDEALANKVLRMAKNGRNFEDLALQYSEDKFYKSKKGKLGYKRINSRGEVSRTAFEVGPDQIAGPIKYNKGWSVIKTGEKKPAMVQSFEEVRTQVQSKVRAEKIKERREAWEEEVKNEYAVTINEKLLEQI